MVLKNVEGFYGTIWTAVTDAIYLVSLKCLSLYEVQYF